MKIWNLVVCVWIGVIRGAMLDNGELVLTSSPLPATDGEPFTLICSIKSGFVVNIAWLQKNTTKVITQLPDNCTKQEPHMGNNIDRFSESCNDTVHSIEFRFNSTTDQGGWQCGKLVIYTYIYPRSNILSVGMEEHALSEFSGVASSVTSTQPSSTTTRYRETMSESVTVTTQKASTVNGDLDTIYIVVGAVGGAVLLAVVVVGIVCIRRRRQAAHQKEDMKGKRNVEATPGYQNRTSCYTVENELYGKTRGITPINEAEDQKDNFIMSDAYASVDMAATSTCTPREEGASCDVDLDNLYAKPDKGRSPNVQHVSDIYAEVKKSKKRRQDDPKASEDVNTWDGYEKTQQGLKGISYKCVKYNDQILSARGSSNSDDTSSLPYVHS